MSEVAVHELRHHTAEVLRRAASGESITITVRGRPVAQLGPLVGHVRRPWTRQEFIDFVDGGRQADPGLRDELRLLTEESTDGLGPLR